jgi:hypothetical protein
MRKCPYVRNEDLLFAYRKKALQNLQHLTGAHLPKLAFILARSALPFEELVLKNALSDSISRRSNHYEIGSLLPSLARSRFRNFEAIEQLCTNYALSLSKDVTKSLANPSFLKIFLERLI